MDETDNTDKTQHRSYMLERILAEENFKQAVKQVKRNKGTGGIEGMTVKELTPWLAEHQEELKQKLLDGKYRPQAVRRVEIPKDNGKTRNLGIPNVVDRVIQQAICQVLSPVYEEQSSDFSFGFRPKRSAHMALEQCVVFADDMLIFCKSKRAAERVLESISKFLEEKLFLKVNREKTQVAHIKEIKFLGYGFYFDRQGKTQLRVHPKSFMKLKGRLKELTSRSNGMSGL